MSNYEKHIGKLKIVDLSEFNNDIGKFYESKCRKMLVDKTEDEIQKMYKYSVKYRYRINQSPWQYLFDNIWYDYKDKMPRYYTVNGIVYETIEDKEVDDDTSFLKDNGDGTYDYFIKFYNEDTYLSECIEYELEKLNTNKN